MNKFIDDTFVTDLIGYKAYTLKKKISLITKDIENLSRPFFLTIKSNKKLLLKSKSKNLKIKLVSKLIYFQRKFKKNQIVEANCRNAKKNDLNQLLTLAKENNLNSRFIKDNLISVNFKKNYRSEWIKNFFKKKRGNYLIVATQKKKILGFILILKKKKQFVIDLIVTGKKYRKKKVATSLINYINNNFMNRNIKLFAGTQKDNLIAIKMYKKLCFVKKKEETFCYHVHGR